MRLILIPDDAQRNEGQCCRWVQVDDSVSLHQTHTAIDADCFDIGNYYGPNREWREAHLGGVVSDTGLLDGLPVNSIASQLLDRGLTPHPSDFPLVGPCLLMAADEDGETVEVPASVVEWFAAHDIPIKEK